MGFLFFGGVPERSKGADCKSVGSAFGGSNPPPSTRWPSVGMATRTGNKDQHEGDRTNPIRKRMLFGRV